MTKTAGRLIFVLVLWIVSLMYYLNCQALPDPSEKTTIAIIFWVFTAVSLCHGAILSKHMHSQGFRIRTLALQKQEFKTIGKKIALFLFIAAYISLLSWLGFFTSSLLAFVGLSFLLGTRNIIKTSVLGAILLCFVYGLFVFILHLELPQGFII